MMNRRECETVAEGVASIAILTTSTMTDVIDLLKVSMRGLEKALLSDKDKSYKLGQAMLAQELTKAYIKRATQLEIL